MSNVTVLIDYLDENGQLQFRERLVLSSGKRTFTIGRSVDADVTVNDGHVAALHAMLEITPDGHVLATDLGSVNGLIISGKKFQQARGESLPGNLLQIGGTRMRVRSTLEQLAPEKLLGAPAASLRLKPVWIASASMVVVAAQSLFECWVGAPSDWETSIVIGLGVIALATAVWVTMWALLSRLVRHEWRWSYHAAIALAATAVLTAIDGMLDLGWFAFALPPGGMRGAWMAVIALGFMLYLHTIYVSDGGKRRRTALLAGIIATVLGGGGIWFMERYFARDVNYIDAQHRIYPPAIRMRMAGSVEDYFKRAGTLRTAADAKRDALQADDAVDDE